MTRIVEGQLPYTGGTGIGIDANKVISVLLREEDNLIQVNGDNELYTDLQLAVNITPSDDFPVGVTVGKVLAEDGWSQNGLLLNWKTTSGDYARWLYGADGELYFDNGTGTWKQVYYSSEVDALFTQLRGELATVAFTGDYNDLLNRPSFVQLQSDWNQIDTDSPDYIKNKPTIPTVNNATLTIQKNGTTVETWDANSSTNKTANITVPNVINNVTSTDTNNALSALQGKNLQDQIDDLKAIGRFLSLWDATTGQPTSFPLSTPYNYQTGDYYLVETISTATPPVNYRPNGVQYTGTASTTPETEELEVGDLYIYDGTVWLLQLNHGKSVSFANLAGQPSDNANLATALNAKADTSSLATVATTGDYDDLLNKPTIPSAQVNSDWNANSGVAEILNKPTIPTDTNQLTNGAGYVTASYHDSSKQDTLVSGTNIKTVNSNSLLGSGNLTLNDIKVSATAPSSPTEGMVWYDTTNDQLKVYDGTNWNVTGKEYNAGLGTKIGDNYSAMQGPCPSGFHIPTSTEWTNVYNAGETIGAWSSSNKGGFKTYLKLSLNGSRYYSNGNVLNAGERAYYWCSNANNSGFWNVYLYTDQAISFSQSSRSTGGNGIRAFKDTPIIPDSSWNTLYNGSPVATGAGIFYNSTLGLISISADGITRYTIQDRNLGATSADTTSSNSYGYYYQRGNNYGFPTTGSVSSKSSTKVDATNYGPLNYYSSSTFITVDGNWDSSNNYNLRGGVTGVVSNTIFNTGVLSVNGQTGDVSLYTAITVTLTTAGWSSSTQSVTATGVTASNTVIVSPDPSSIDDYTNAKVYCSAQASDSLTFTCSTTPTNDITVNVVILN